MSTKKVFEITRVYRIAAESLDDARTELARPNAGTKLTWESVVTLPMVIESTPRTFAKEALRQLTGRGYPRRSPQTEEPRRQS